MDARDLQRALLSKLQAVEDRRSHLVFYWVSIQGKDYRAAKFSHSVRGQLPPHVPSDTAKRLKLRTAEIHRLVDCSLSGKGFQELWANRLGPSAPA